jgi:uncharacterized protein (TIGR02284 family)
MPRRETIGTLNRLIRTCRDVEALCAACSEAMNAKTQAQALRQRSEEWARQGDELQALVLLLDGKPATAGSWRAPTARTRITLKCLALGRDDLLILDSAFHSQLRALERFEESLEGYLPERIRRTVSLHAQRIAERLEGFDALPSV